MSQSSNKENTPRFAFHPRHRAFAFVLGAIATYALVAVSTSFADESTERPNIVFILVDDMGYGDPSCYNSESKIPTRHIDSLAAAGMRFTDAHASGPLCHVSRYGLLTGRYPFRRPNYNWREHALIDPGQATIASVLKSAGYRTAMVGKWHLGFEENGYENPLPGGPIDVGFDSYFGIRASTDIPPYFYIRGREAVQPPTVEIEANQSDGWSPIQGAFWRAGQIAPDLQLKDVLPRFTDEAIDVIRGHADREQESPLFLYLAYPAPHTPWLPSDEFIGRSGASMYGDFTVMVDAMIGRVLQAIDDAKMADNTLVIFSSDNGPVWYDEDVERFDHDASGGLRGMKADAWECGHRMPFIVRWPGVVKAGAVSDQLISFVDVLSTFADLTGVELADDAGPDSFSFLPVLRGEQPQGKPVRPSLALQSGGNTMMIRVGEWKLINALGSGGFSQPRKVIPGPTDPAGQLYHLGRDPGETTNVYSDHPDIVLRLSAELDRLRSVAQSR